MDVNNPMVKVRQRPGSQFLQVAGGYNKVNVVSNQGLQNGTIDTGGARVVPVRNM